MVRFTQLVRLSDALPLAQSVEDDQGGVDLTKYKQQAKVIYRKLTSTSETHCTIESGPMALHYMIHPPPNDPSSVVYLAITDHAYPRKLVFRYLDELAREFGLSHGQQVYQRNLRPYAFVGFAESATSSNLDRLNEDLQDVQKIMTKNMEDLLWRGDSLDHMSTLSSSLRDESLKYRRAARKINVDAMIRKYAPIGAIAVLFLFIVYLKVW
ncbi:SNAP receptor [Malassezia yamatoensis]|uniref:Protein transport protein SEC22 n=1 Tax=Malassezia yamatoensis TaxID=253288 RepID=A0AAJ6CGN7_9BASI|nr:SNAP receptor [Malassezia yamatoensis]